MSPALLEAMDLVEEAAERGLTAAECAALVDLLAALSGAELRGLRLHAIGAAVRARATGAT